MKFMNCGDIVFSSHKLILKALDESFTIEGDAVALLVELVCVGVAWSLAFLGHVLHLEPVAKVGRPICRCRPQDSLIHWTVVSTLS